MTGTCAIGRSLRVTSIPPTPLAMGVKIGVAIGVTIGVKIGVKMGVPICVQIGVKMGVTRQYRPSAHGVHQ